jgi:small-conductance mechanosensitive channel
MIQEEDNVTDKITEVITEDIWGTIERFLDWGFHFGTGDSRVNITIGLILLVAAAFFTTKILLRWIHKLFTRNLDTADTLKFVSVGKFFNYIVYIIVIFSVLSFVGVNVTPVLAASAALLVGVGLALQEIFQDVLGGIFIIFDKTLLVGDIIEVEDKVGRVIDIQLRTTRALTRDDKVIIIPNHKFIQNTVFNYTQNHKTTRESVTVGVAYGSDTQKVKQLLLDSVAEQKDIVKSPTATVLFNDFGDSALIFTIYFYVTDSFVDPIIKSNIRFTIDRLFRENNISIPFPQRDVHLFTNNISESPSSLDGNK